MSATIVSVNVGRPRRVMWHGKPVETAIWKEPVTGRVPVADDSVHGDTHADRVHHGGATKAVYAYAAEDYDWWSEQLGRDLPPGTFGENLTTAGIALADAVVGERWRVGTAILRVTEPRIACYKLGLRMDDTGFPRRFAAAGRSGAHLAIEREGTLAAGEAVTRLTRPDHGVTVGLINRAYHVDHGLADRLIGVGDVPAGWQRWAARFASTA